MEWTSDYEFESNEQMLNILNDMGEVINYDQNESSRTVDYYNELKTKLYMELDKYFQNPNIKEEYEELFRETINSLSSEADIATENDSNNSEKEKIADSLSSEADITTKNDLNNSEKEENANISALNQQTSFCEEHGEAKDDKGEIADSLSSEADIATENDSNNSEKEENATISALNQQTSTCRGRGKPRFDKKEIADLEDLKPNSHSVTKGSISCNKSSGNVYSQSDHHREDRRGHKDRKGGGNKMGDQSGSSLNSNEYVIEEYEELFRETINSLSSEADIATENDSNNSEKEKIADSLSSEADITTKNDLNNSEKEENATISALNQQTSTCRGRGKPRFDKKEIADLEDLKPNSHSVTKGSISCNKSSGNVYSQSDHHREDRRGHKDRKGGGNKMGDQSGSSLNSNEYVIAIIDATEIAGFKCHKLVNENSAIARLFSLVTTDMPSTNHQMGLFLNIGQTSAETKFKIIEDLIKKTLDDAKLKPKDIEKIVLTGGSVRIPKIKQIIERIFKKNINGTMNEEDAVSMGGSLFTTSRSHYKIQIPRMIGYRESSNLKTIIVDQQDDDLSSDGTFTKPFRLICSDENLKVYENYGTDLENKGLCEYFSLVNKEQSQNKKYYHCMFYSDINGIISLKLCDSNNTKNNETEMDEKSKHKSVMLIKKLSGSNLNIEGYRTLENNLQNDIKQKKVKLEAKNDLETTINTIMEWTSDYEFESNEQILNILNVMEDNINYDQNESSRTVDYYNELKIELYMELDKYFQNPNIKEKYEELFCETISSLSSEADIATKNDSNDSEKEKNANISALNQQTSFCEEHGEAKDDKGEIADSLSSEADIATRNDSNDSKKEENANISALNQQTSFCEEHDEAKDDKGEIVDLLSLKTDIATKNDSNNFEEEKNANTPALNQQILSCGEHSEVKDGKGEIVDLLSLKTDIATKNDSNNFEEEENATIPALNQQMPSCEEHDEAKDDKGEIVDLLSLKTDIATKNDSNNSEKEENTNTPALNQQTSTCRGRGKPKFGKKEIADLKDLKPNSHSVTKGSISCNKSSGNVYSQSDHHREGRRGHEDRKGGGNKMGDKSGSSLDSNKDDIVSNNERKDLPSE
uniref:VWFA domain-containing protein n=1 Tax=Rhabditophanes sp. KR3021 TaxID=114890 RepID=A0AC35TYP2_9BILA